MWFGLQSLTQKVFHAKILHLQEKIKLFAQTELKLTWEATEISFV